MDDAPLVFGVRVNFSHSLQHTQTLISDNEPDALQTAAFQLRYGLLSHFRMVCGNFILLKTANYVFFYIFKFAQLNSTLSL